MTEHVNKEKQNPTERPGKDSMSLEGWSVRPHKLMNEEMQIVTKDLADVIIIQNPGQPHQALHPINGDFGIVALFMQDGEDWLKNLEKTEIAYGQGHLKWLEWKTGADTNELTPNAFFELLTEAATPATAMGM